MKLRIHNSLSLRRRSVSLHYLLNQILFYRYGEITSFWYKLDSRSYFLKFSKKSNEWYECEDFGVGRRSDSLKWFDELKWEEWT